MAIQTSGETVTKSPMANAVVRKRYSAINREKAKPHSKNKGVEPKSLRENGLGGMHFRGNTLCSSPTLSSLPPPPFPNKGSK